MHIHTCDLCGEAIDDTREAMLVTVQARAGGEQFEICRSCGTQLLIAFKQAKLQITKHFRITPC